MKYILLIYNNPATYEAWPEDQRNELFGEVDTIMKELTERGEFVGGQGLADPSTTKTVRVRDGAPHENLVGVRAVDVGGVQEVDAELERAVDGGDRLVVVAGAVELGHAHAAEAEGGDGRALEAQSACLHGGHAIAES